MSESYTKYVSNFKQGISTVLNTKRESTVHSMLPKHYNFVKTINDIPVLKKDLIAQRVSYNIGNKTIFETVSRTYSLLTRHTSQINFTDRIKITCAEQENFPRGV